MPDHGVEVSQDRGGDHGLGLGRLELVVLAGGQMPVASAVDGVGALGSPDRPPGRDTQAWSALAGELVRPVKVPDSFCRGARPACLTSARAVANRRGSPVSARIVAAPTAEMPVIEVTSSVSSSSVEHGNHALLGVGQLVLGLRPVLQ